VIYNILIIKLTCATGVFNKITYFLLNYLLKIKSMQATKAAYVKVSILNR